jgi:hypothetical protein
VKTAVEGARYLRALTRELRRTISPDEARRRLEEQLRTRETAFLTILERAVYGHPPSPYRALLRNAGVELGDAAALVREHGLEGALDRLHDAGVYITLEEFKGRRPVERAGVVVETRPRDFDSPLLGPTVAGSTGGSRSGQRFRRDVRRHADSAVAHRLIAETFDLEGRPFAVWRPAPPGGAGLGMVLAFAIAGLSVERWFSQTRVGLGRRASKDALLTVFTLLAGRFAGKRLPFPEHVPLGDAAPVAVWLAEQCRRGRPACLSTTPSSAVRACRAADQRGLDISGSFFRLGGEPYTPGKAAVIEASGVQAISNYTMSEIGRIGIACAEPQALDDLHVMTNALAVIQRPRVVAADGDEVGALLLTALRPAAPKVMINVESDDYATLEERDCGCVLGTLGLSWHVHGVRSFEKLTTEGMTFLGPDLIELLDEVLPARFGGHPTDYQLAEEEVDGLSRVSVVVAPAIGPLDVDAVLETVLRQLARGPAYKAMMAEVWRAGATLRVVRREPFVTPGGKVLPLHVLGAAARR